MGGSESILRAWGAITFLFVALENVNHLLGCHASVVFAVDDQFGADAATAKTAPGFESKAGLGIGFAGLEAGEFLHLFLQLGRHLDFLWFHAPGFFLRRIDLLYLL